MLNDIYKGLVSMTLQLDIMSPMAPIPNCFGSLSKGRAHISSMFNVPRLQLPTESECINDLSESLTEELRRRQ